MLIYVCHFHHHFLLLLLLQLPLVKFDHYRDTRAAILDPCIQGILKIICPSTYYSLKIIEESSSLMSRGLVTKIQIGQGVTKPLPMKLR